VLYLNIMTRIKGHKYDNQIFEKGGRGFPYLVWLDADGKVLAPQGDRSTAGFQKTYEQLATYLELKKKAAAGDAAAGIELALIETELGIIDFGELESKLQGKRLSKEQKARVDLLEVEAGVKDALALLRAGRGKPESMTAAGKALYKFQKQGRAPESKQGRTIFFNILARYGQQTKNVVLMESSVKALDEIYKDEPRAKRFLAGLHKSLAALKAAVKQKADPESKSGSGCGG